MTTGFVIAATGLKAEARIAERSSFVKAIAGGGREERLASLLEQSIANGARGIISFGIAGGLRPGLPSGTVVVGTSVIHSSGRIYPADTRWSDRLFEALPNAESGAVIGSGSVIADRDEKRAIYLKSGAFVADMESHIVAQTAHAYGLPFAVLRVIADTSDQELPHAAVNGLNPDGTPNIAAVLQSLAAQPTQLWSLLRTAGATRRAMKGATPLPPASGPGPRMR